MKKTVWPHAIVVFCDDIRQEVGNKQSLMGIYEQELVFSVPEEGTHLPQICASVRLEWPRGQALTEGGYVKASLPDGQVDIRLPLDGFAEFAATQPDRQKDIARLTFKLVNFPCLDGVSLSIHMHLNGKSKCLAELHMRASAHPDPLLPLQ